MIDWDAIAEQEIADSLRKRTLQASVGPVDEFYSPDQARDREGRWTAHRGRLTSLSSDRIERAYNKGPEGMFGNSQTTTTIPWPSAPRLKGRRQFDPDLVQRAMANPVIEKVDPRLLYGTQPSIVRSHFDHYYAGSPGLAADQHQASNAHPIVYVNTTGQHLLLSGHHRAAVALSKGDDLDAIVVRET